jgi:hypothetical protein
MMSEGIDPNQPETDQQREELENQNEEPSESVPSGDSVNQNGANTQSLSD